jgi:hypothetical protein
MAEDDDIDSYWEDIRFYPPDPVDPIIQLRAEDQVRKSIAEELGLTLEDYSSITFDRFMELTRAMKSNKLAAQQIRDLHERPVPQGGISRRG